MVFTRDLNCRLSMVLLSVYTSNYPFNLVTNVIYLMLRIQVFYSIYLMFKFSIIQGSYIGSSYIMYRYCILPSREIVNLRLNLSTDLVGSCKKDLELLMQQVSNLNRHRCPREKKYAILLGTSVTKTKLRKTSDCFMDFNTPSTCRLPDQNRGALLAQIFNL